MTGPLPTPPASGWTPDTIVEVLLPWFNASMSMEPLKAYLEHYRLLDPSIPNEVPVSPDVFAQLSFLYNRFWLARALFKTCPDFGRRLVEEPFYKLASEVEAHQASLPDDPARIEMLTGQTQAVLQTLREINNRQVFYTQVVASAKTEPPADQNFDADNGVVRWSYGFQHGDMPGITISSSKETISEEWKIGWREHVFHYSNSSKIIVGWDIVCNRNSLGGDWHKVSDRIIGRSVGDVYVKSDYDRGYSWSITWYLVDANLYPAGPWTVAAAHAPEFLSAACEAAGKATEFWTPERMAEAAPIDRAVTGAEAVPAGRRSSAAEETSSAGFRGRTEPSERAADPLIAPSTSRVEHPEAFPNRTVGKLFFMMGGQPKVASGVVVNRHGIMTAAHCITLDGQEASRMLFVPAYRNGREPFGRWVIDALHWPNAWKEHEIPAWDVGFCKVKPLPDGRSIGDVVGWVGLAWGGIAGCWDARGYPCQSVPDFPFTGEEPWQSVGSRVAVTDPSTVGKHDTLTAGSDGGPWFVAGDPWVVNGVQSQSLVARQESRGPEFSDWVGTFYTRIFG